MTGTLIKTENKFNGQVTEIRLNQPPANILNAKMMAEISHQISDDENNPHKKLIIISAEGKHFSYGASVEEHTPEKVQDMLPAFHKLIGKILSSPLPTLAQVSGLCLGGSFEFVLACSFLFAEARAKFAFPEIQLGVFPPVAAALLPALGHTGLATKMILTGNQISAEELFRNGLVHTLIENGPLDATVSSFIEEHILPKSASSLRMAHKAARMTVSQHYEKFIKDLEKFYLQDLMSTDDAVEGIRSFLDKRLPRWKDR